MHIFMLLLPLIQLLGGWGTVRYHWGLMCLFTVMMTHNARPIQGNVCSKGIIVDPCISKTKGSACLGCKVVFCCEPISSCPSCPHCLRVCCVNNKWHQEGRSEQELRSVERQRDFGKVPHHTVYPVDRTNSSACVWGGEGLLKDSF